MTRDELAATLVQLRRRVDAHFDAAVARTPAAFRCAAGCSACCHARFSVFAVEAAPIRRALATLARTDPALRARVRIQADDPAHQDHCALLVDGRCTVYAERPLICRSHGLPIAADGHISHCPLNFTAEPPPPASTLRLDAVNQPLSVLAALWHTETEEPAPPADAMRSPPASAAPGERVDLAFLARAPDLPPSPSPAPSDPLTDARKND